MRRQATSTLKFSPKVGDYVTLHGGKAFEPYTDREFRVVLVEWGFAALSEEKWVLNYLEVEHHLLSFNIRISPLDIQTIRKVKSATESEDG